jgi:hypothetical protein
VDLDGQGAETSMGKVQKDVLREREWARRERAIGQTGGVSRRSGRKVMTMTSLWRQAFDTIERPLAAASESWVQGKTFMDLAAVTIRVQRRLTADGQRMTEQWLHAWDARPRRPVQADEPGCEPGAPGA